MRKGIKILAKVLSITILLAIFLPVTFTLVLNIEGIQNRVVALASEFATKKLGTRVSIDHIDIDLFSHVRVEGFYVEDYEQDTLLYVPCAEATISSLNIPTDGLCFSHAEAWGARLYIKEMANGELNIRPIVQRLQNPNGKNKFRMSIDEIDAHDAEFRYERLVHRDPEYGIDYFDMQIYDIDGHLKDFGVYRSQVWGDVTRLSAKERSGFVVGNITSHFFVDKGILRFREFVADTEQSHVYVPSMDIEGEDWTRYKYYIDEVMMYGVVTDTHISTDDLGYFAPGLREWNTTAYDIDATFEGTVRDLSGELNHASFGQASHASGTFHIVGLPDWRTSRYTVGITELYATATDVDTLTDNILKEPLPDNVMDIISRANRATLHGTFSGRLDNFRVIGNMQTNAGKVLCDVRMSKQSSGRYNLSGTVDTNDLLLGRLLAQQSLGGVDSHIILSGTLGSRSSGGIVGDVDLNLSSLTFGSYTYSGIHASGVINADDYYVEVNSDDPNLDLALMANMHIDGNNSSYGAQLNIARADLHALGFNRRDTVSVLSVDIGAELAGGSLDDLDGYISIANADYTYPAGELQADILRIDVESNESYRTLYTDSEFFELNFRSKSSYRELFDYVYNSLKTYVPLLYDSQTGQIAVTSDPNNPSDYTVLTFEARDDINDLFSAIAEGIVMAPNTELGLIFNPRSNNLTVRGSSEMVEYSGLIMANMEFDINNTSIDSLSMHVQSDGVYMGSRLIMPNFNLHGGARENRISLTAGFRGDGSSAMLGLTAQFSRNAETRRRSVHIDITPSHFTTTTQQWRLYSRGIDIDSTRLSVRDLRIARPEQQLVINGVASRSRNDSIQLLLDNFDLSPLSALISRWGYSVGATSNGYATVKSALSNPEIEAHIDLDSIQVNNIAAPPQVVTSNWDFERNRARVIIADKATSDTTVRGYYQPQGNRYLARARMEGVKLELIAPFLRDIISDIEGEAEVYAEIIGQGRQATLSGNATVDSIGVSVDYTNVRYTAPYAELSIVNNHIYADRIPVYDPEHNVGHYSMDISLEHLSNVTYDIDIDANQMLVLNTNETHNDLFYGHVYASGTAQFSGDRRGVKMDIEASSGNNSQFFMPLSGKEDVAYADFVRFTEHVEEAPDTTAFLTRRMMAYERRHRPASVAGGGMDIDMTLNVTPNIEMQLVIDPTVGDIIKGRGTGQLTMHIVPKANIFEMRGDFSITEGNYLFTLQNILNKKFDVVPGSSIHWTGDPLGAMLQIDAIYRTKASLRPLLGNSVQGIDVSRAVPVECYIKLSDELMSPTVTFDVQIPNVAPEIQTVIQSTLNDQQAMATQMFWLLAANTFSAEDTGAMGASLSATTGFELLSNQLSNWLSGDNYNIVLRYRPRTELTGDEVDFGFSKSWLNNRLIVEVEGGYLSDASIQATENASNFVAEGYITWLIDPDGTFRFRGFTQTIDRYGENQGMQESGLGLYYGKSFNTFRELGASLRDGLRRDREAQAERRELRERRRAARRDRHRHRSTTNEQSFVVDTTTCDTTVVIEELPAAMAE